MMTEYAVLRFSDGPAKRATLGQRLGAQGVQDPPPPRLTREDLDQKQAAEASESQSLVLARRMPTKLISPLGSDASTVAGNWGVKAIGADSSPFDGAGCRVALLDTGIQLSHPAFVGVRLVQKDFTGSGDGDLHGHGTHCAGTIFGRDVDGLRIGVARGVTQAFVAKVLDDAGGGSSLATYEGLMWAMRCRVDVISISLGLDFPGYVSEKVAGGWPIELATSEALEAFLENVRMFDTLRDQARLKVFGEAPLMVAASGNESQRQLRADFRLAPSLPSALLDISVGAVGPDGAGYRVADFSNAPPKVVAPGVGIVSASLDGHVIAMDGTSMACPHVAGVAALWSGKLRQDGEVVSAEALSSYIYANARRDCIKSFADEGPSNVGRGLVTAPRQ